MRKFVVIIYAVLLSNSASASPIIDITKIAGKNKDEVSAYLGKPDSCEESKFGKKCQYKKGDSEIIFINEKADWITVEGIDSVPFSKSALSELGLKPKDPTFSNNYTLRWNFIQGLREVSIFKGRTKSDYVYIKVKTK